MPFTKATSRKFRERYLQQRREKKERLSRRARNAFAAFRAQWSSPGLESESNETLTEPPKFDMKLRKRKPSKRYGLEEEEDDQNDMNDTATESDSKSSAKSVRIKVKKQKRQTEKRDILCQKKGDSESDLVKLSELAAAAALMAAAAVEQPGNEHMHQVNSKASSLVLPKAKLEN
mmetsp:Transcript_7249/g.13510  ORF Transcript_7249/g.13510 Transcript_7249/m.13510 type:complete len:175 (-) Transcript_7249:417-941(-)